MDAHPHDRFLPLAWKELGIHLIGAPRSSGRVSYRYARDLRGQWCVIVRKPHEFGLDISPWFGDKDEATGWLRRYYPKRKVKSRRNGQK